MDEPFAWIGETESDNTLAAIFRIVVVLTFCGVLAVIV